jgi:2,3-bisphosphoglycerate-independent phosphoglycerate mutase
MMVVSADHGNLEMMKDPATHERHTQHTVGPVSVVLVNGPANVNALANGRLADLAPTVLALIGLPQPADMTGHPLLHYAAGQAAKAATA